MTLPEQRVRIPAGQITGHPGACPSQWEGQTEDGRWFYVRYRHGRLTFGFGGTIDDAVNAAVEMGRLAPLEPLEPDDGDMATGAMLTHLAAWIEVVP